MHIAVATVNPMGVHVINRNTEDAERKHASSVDLYKYFPHTKGPFRWVYW